MTSKEIGKIVLYHRKISGLSRVNCAMLAGVGKTAIYDIEHGKETVQINTLFKVLNVLNIQMTFSSPLMQPYRKQQNYEKS